MEPVTDDVVKKEEELLGHLVEKHSRDFTIEKFKQDYLLLGRDLLFEAELAFQRYMISFFHDEGLPVFASLVAEGGKHATSENILYDLKLCMKADLFNKLTGNAAFYAAPYLPLCAYIRSRQKTSIPLFSVLDWSSEQVQSELIQFLRSSYPTYDPKLTAQYFDGLISSFGE